MGVHCRPTLSLRRHDVPVGQRTKMNIGEASAESGVSAKMIRYYEHIQLLRPAARSPAGYRLYSAADIHDLSFIRRARDLGFTVEQIADLLALWRDRKRASADVKRIASEHVGRLERKMTEIREMTDALKFLVNHCPGNHRPDCPIIEELAGRPSNAERVKATSELGVGFKKLG